MGDGFHGVLDPVGSTLVTMARASREAMRQASAALLASDSALAHQVTIRDAEIDVLSHVLEDRVYELVAQQRPGGANVSTLLTALRVAAHVERMGDLAVHVARATLRRHPEAALAPELAELFTAMSVVADDLAAKIVSALTDHDAVLAARLDHDDDAMDELHRRLFTVLLSQEWPMGVEGAIDGALLGRFYERYADQAVNVGRLVASLVADETVPAGHGLDPSGPPATP